MARSRPEPRLLDHDPHALAAVFDELIGAGAGWVNVLPEIPEDVPVPPTPSVLAVFSKRGPVVPLGTWVAPTITGGELAPIEIGIQHGTSTTALGVLAETVGEIPEGWTKLSDSPRRGIVVRAPGATSTLAQATWLLDALAVLCIPPSTGRFVLFRYAG